MEPDAPELVLADKLADYDRLYRSCLKGLPRKEQGGRGYVMVNLHKRLLSSVPAFLRKHEAGARRRLDDARQVPLLRPPADDDDLDEDARDEEDDAFIERAAFDAGQQAAALLDDLLAVATQNAARPDARVLSLAAWINQTRVFSHKLAVAALDTWTAFATLQSRVHSTWAWDRSSTLRPTSTTPPPAASRPSPSPAPAPPRPTPSPGPARRCTGPGRR